MADISRYLQDILSAVYGEEVRGSIHDAIEIINDVSEAVLTTGTAVTGPTSSSEGFFEDSLYLNTNTFELWKCVGVNTWQSQGVTKGADGNGIFSIQKTGTVGLVDTYTITYTNGTSSTFEVTNGADGADGADGSTWYKGTALSGTGTAITGFPGKLNDFYLNSTSGNVYICTKAGGTLPPDAAEWEYVMTLTGGGGGTITVIDHLNSTSSTDALSANQGRVLDGKKQEKFASYSAGLKEEMIGPAGSQTLQLSLDLLAGSNITLEEKNGKIQINSTGGGGGGGLLPYFYIDSEAGATVTVTAPDGSTITPTAVGSGHWECEVPMYGVYTIHSVLAGQGDATVNVTVDDVKEYHITDNHFDFTINVIAPSGSTIRITGGGETYTGTGTGSSQAFAVHQASTQYTVQVMMDGNTKSETVTSAATTGQSTTVSIAFGTITVNVAQDFITAGSTITCTKGGTSCTGKVAASTVTFRVPETGTWEIAGTISGDTYTVDAVVSSLSTAVTVSLETLPDGKTVTPTDDIQIWLACAGITDKTSYTTLDDVLADHDTLARLISSENAVDYMARSKTWIGGAEALVPTMTGATSPTGYEASARDQYPSNDAYHAFDGTVTPWCANSSAVGDWIKIKLANAVKANKLYMLWHAPNWSSVVKFYIEGSHTGNDSDFTPLSNEISITPSSTANPFTLDFENNTEWEYYRLRFTTSIYSSSSSYFGIRNLQFYSAAGIVDDETAMRYIGKRNYAADTLLADADWREAICNSEYWNSVLNAKVPTMTDATHPSGEAVSENHYGTMDAWLAFDGDDSTRWASSLTTTASGQSSTAYVQYKFASPVCVRKLYIKDAINATYPIQYTNIEISGSNDGITFTPVYTHSTAISGGEGDFTFENNNSYTYYRINITAKSNYSGTIQNPRASTIQMYGRSDVSETNIDIYSAANDTVSISGNGLSLTCVTDATGHGTIAKSSLPAGTYTFTSSVALDPDNLDGSHYYSKQITIPNSEIVEAYVMPDTALYWWGYKVPIYFANVLRERITYQTNNMYQNGDTRPEPAFITSFGFDVNVKKIKAIRKWIDAGSYQAQSYLYTQLPTDSSAMSSYRITGSMLSKTTSNTIELNQIDLSSLSISQTTYLGLYTESSGATQYIYALWYEE